MSSWIDMEDGDVEALDDMAEKYGMERDDLAGLAVRFLLVHMEALDGLIQVLATRSAGRCLKLQT